MFWQWLALLTGAYLLGSIPSAYLLVKLSRGIDIRQFGSGNVGSTNTVRAAGKKTGILVFLIDSLKGAIPTLIGLKLGGENMAAAAGAIAVIGHMFPVWLKFKGGKGVATTIGMSFVLTPLGALITFAIWFLTLLLTGYVSLGSCVGGVALWICYLCGHHSFVVNIIILAVVLLVIWKHRSNFRNIKNGTESKSFRK
ncbi:MAG: glycerol-3-phosphate 1-O-acyltransferase PlsY [Firmicutes bacterium]|nr:glycerol-3-phosphate 1-O-acyltransferase PlsY [Bacillota bacterium]